MPTINYNKKELKKLVGKKITDEKLGELVTLVKPNLEEVTEEEFTIEHTADRADLFGIEGLARSISSYIGNGGLKKYSVFKSNASVKVDHVPIRPYISCAIVKDVKMSKGLFESIISIQEMLNGSLGRNRESAAIGIHDLDKINGPVAYSGVLREEEMIPLESSEKMKLVDVLEKNDKGKAFGSLIKTAKLWPVFKDRTGIISLPPIINSNRTKVTDKTKNLFIEVTGIDKEIVRQVMSILVTNFAERKFLLENVKLKHELKTETTPDINESVIEVSLENVNGVLGLDVSSEDVVRLLGKMGYDALVEEDKIEVIVPSYRNDILHPVDIIEDIGIAYGFNNFKPKIPNLSTIGKPLDLEKLCEKSSLSLTGFGFQEIMRSCLSNKKDQFEKMLQEKSECVEIENPQSAEYACVRTWLLPGLLKFLSLNKHHEYPQNVFETGDVVIPDKKSDNLSRNERRVAGVVCHSKSGFVELKSIVDGLMKNLNLEYVTKPCSNPVYIKGRAVDVYVEKKKVGSFGELHPQVLNNWEINMPTSAFEIVLENL